MAVPDTEWLVTLSKQLNILSLFTYLLPSAIGIWHWHYLSAAQKKVVWFVVVAGTLLNALSEISRVVYHNNLIFVYLITWTETFFLSWAFYTSFHSAATKRRFIWAIIVFIGVALVQTLYFRGPYASNIYTRIAQSILLSGGAMVYFEQTLQELRNIHLNRDPMFLISAGVILYFAGTLMVYLLEDSMYAQKQFQQVWIMYSIQFILLIIFNCFLTYALYQARQSKTENNLPGQII
ncbi:hypothetical protein [Hymenobacter elongatus]|uniref:Uncharacterized protein n=1 Tax=Hymenobacter elongatus TaxID=877208 RepID=A0A4Z0PL66_9BACT|nr:hypothetical protein [Hymenobacter elongatus]TGE16765.1 hypothetical protein E5J99_08625 [Hymenobacter elongatus]